MNDEASLNNGQWLIYFKLARSLSQISLSSSLYASELLRQIFYCWIPFLLQNHTHFQAEHVFHGRLKINNTIWRMTKSVYNHHVMVIQNCTSIHMRQTPSSFCLQNPYTSHWLDWGWRHSRR